jgi:hypothetical protein
MAILEIVADIAAYIQEKKTIEIQEVAKIVGNRLSYYNKKDQTEILKTLSTSIAEPVGPFKFAFDSDGSLVVGYNNQTLSYNMATGNFKYGVIFKF